MCRHAGAPAFSASIGRIGSSWTPLAPMAATAEARQSSFFNRRLMAISQIAAALMKIWLAGPVIRALMSAFSALSCLSPPREDVGVEQ